jgi:hypothetical protein
MRDALNSSHHEGHKSHEGNKNNPFVYFVSACPRLLGVVLKIFTPENILAFALFLIVAALIILTTDDSPNWIYQGF